MQDAVTIDAGAQTFGAGVLQALIAALRRSSPGDLIRVTGTNLALAAISTAGAASRGTPW